MIGLIFEVQILQETNHVKVVFSSVGPSCEANISSNFVGTTPSLFEAKAPTSSIAFYLNNVWANICELGSSPPLEISSELPHPQLRALSSKALLRYFGSSSIVETCQPTMWVVEALFGLTCG
jgi:hypothetical protein